MQELIKLDYQLPKGVYLNKTQLFIPPGTNHIELVSIAKRITNVHNGFSWWIGDLAAYAIHNLESPQEFLIQLSNATDLKMSSIKQQAWLAKKFPVRDRIIGLGSHHHLVVAHLPRAKRQMWLRKAVTKGWPCRVLEQHVVPREKQLTSIILRVPVAYATNKRFILGLEVFCKTWNITRYRFWGALRHAGHRSNVKIPA